MSYLDLQKMMDKRIKEAGGVPDLAIKSGVNAGHIRKIQKGTGWSVSNVTLLKMGIRRIVTYELCEPEQPDFE